ncbi:MAG: radical SAM protein [Candidatus Delongbacteria bacterium]|nr:radical SAM protein [Candidatus Delongbacteria bacterium]
MINPDDYPIRKIYDLFLELSNICNFDCPFCPNSRMTRPRGIMPYEFAVSLLDQIRQEGISQRIVLFLMGEPLLVPYLYQILPEIQKRDLVSIIHTNASLLNDEHSVRLLQSPLNELHISLQTFGQEALNQKSKRPIDFRLYMDGILNLVEQHYHAGSPMILKIHFFSRTWQSVFRGRELNAYVTHSFRYLVDFFNQWMKDRLDLNLSSHRLPFSLNQAYEVEILPRIFLVSRQVTTFGGNMGKPKKYKARFGSCQTLINQVGILWDGRVTACCNDFDGKLILGDTHRQPLIEILNSPIALKLYYGFKAGRIWHPLCRTCRGGNNVWYWLIKQAASVWAVKTGTSFYRKKRISWSGPDQANQGDSHVR